MISFGGSDVWEARICEPYPTIEDDATATVVYAFDGEIQFVDLSTGWKM